MIKHTNKTKRLILLVVSALIIIAAGVYLYKSHTAPKPGNTISVEEQKQNDTKKSEVIEKTDDTATTYTPPANPDTIELDARQSDASQVVLTTKLTGYSDGTCKLSVTNGAKSFTQSATVIYQTSFSTCAGFSVPISNLGVGKWNISLDVTSGGTTLTKTTTLEVQ